jgi:hypothetical protein
MPKKKAITREELEAFMERLSRRPELYEQFHKILDVSDPSLEGKGLDLNQVEGLLIPRIQETGRLALKGFAEQVEEDVALEIKQIRGMQQREKKT